MNKVTLYSKAKTGKMKVWSIWTEGNIYYVEHGQLGSDKLQVKATVCTAKNVNRANETTPEEQAELEAFSKISKQQDKGYFYLLEDAESAVNNLPMLAMDYTKQGHRVTYPCLVSPKLDGVRCFASVDGDKVTLTSRMGKEYPCPPQLRKDLVSLSGVTGHKLFDGEIYKHGMPLQDIVSAIKKPNENTNSLQYWIFDLPLVDKNYHDRNLELHFIDHHLENEASCETCVTVLSTRANNETEAEAFLSQFIEEGFEGLMLRNDSGKYEFSKRSADLQKWKRMKDEEALVLDIAEVDKNGEAVLYCKMKDSEKVFKCKMQGSHESRLPENQKHLVGKWITYKYQALTNDGLPQFPVGLYERDCDEKGNPLV